MARLGRRQFENVILGTESEPSLACRHTLAGRGSTTAFVCFVAALTLSRQQVSMCMPHNQLALSTSGVPHPQTDFGTGPDQECPAECALPGACPEESVPHRMQERQVRALLEVAGGPVATSCVHGHRGP